MSNWSVLFCLSDMVAKCWIIKEDTAIFGHVGQSVTLVSVMRGHVQKHGMNSWYHEAQEGRIRVKFSEYFYRPDVISWSNISYTVENLTVMDSGRYFAVRQSGIFARPSIGSSLFLVVTGKTVSQRANF